MEFKTASRCAVGTCVAIAISDSGVYVRDTKVEDGPVLEFTHDEWNAFIAGVKNNEFEASVTAAT